MLFVSRICSGAPARCFATALCLLAAPGLAGADDDSIGLSPNNPDVLAVIQVGEIIGSPAFKKISAQFPDLAKKLDEPLGPKTKLTARDIESIFVSADTANQDFVVVLNLTGEFNAEGVIEAEQRANPEEIGDYTLYLIEDDKALCLVDERTIAIGPGKTLRAVLNRDDDAELSDELDAGWKNFDDQQVYVVATLGALTQQATGAIPPGLPLSPETLGKLKTATFTANAGKNEITLRTDLNCTDTATAQQLKALLDIVLQGALQGNDTPAATKQALTAVKSSVEEEYLTIGFNVGLDVVIEQIKSQLTAATTAVPTP